MAFSTPLFSQIASGTNGGTTSAADSTGADLLVLVVTYYHVNAGTVSISDSKGNTWTARTEYTSGVPSVQTFYCTSPTVGTGHTFTISGSTIFAAIMAMGFNGSNAVPYDSENGANAASATSVQSGSVSPAGDNELFISGLTLWNIPDTPSIDNGFTLIGGVAFSSGVNFGLFVAYKIQTTGGAENPTWSWTNSAAGDAANLTLFKAAAGPPARTTRPELLMMLAG